MHFIQINERRVGRDWPTFVIAEAGVNHNGEIELAKQLVEVAADAGADAVKFQTFRADRLVSTGAPKAQYQIENTGTSESHYEMLRHLELSRDMHVILIETCRRRGIEFLSSPFDEESADLLELLGVPAFKVPSGELTNIPLLKHIARKKKPMIMSTGMACLGEVESALGAVAGEGNSEVVLLQCVSNYPAAAAEANLRAMATMEAAFGVPVGYSDHTNGIEVPIAAAALGAVIIEKHFTLDRSLPGPDHVASLEPSELTAMVRGIRTAQAALGHGRKIPSDSEKSTARAARRSLVAARDIGSGEVIDDAMIALKRPGTGLAASLREYVVGRVARVSLREGELFTLEMLQ
jgi:N-acetylneuraminate synthase